MLLFILNHVIYLVFNKQYPLFQSTKKSLLSRIAVLKMKPIRDLKDKIFNHRMTNPTIYLALIVILIVFLVFDTVGDRVRMISALGMAVLILFGFIFSAHPAR